MKYINLFTIFCFVILTSCVHVTLDKDSYIIVDEIYSYNDQYNVYVAFDRNQNNKTNFRLEFFDKKDSYQVGDTVFIRKQ